MPPAASCLTHCLNNLYRPRNSLPRLLRCTLSHSAYISQKKPSNTISSPSPGAPTSNHPQSATSALDYKLSHPRKRPPPLPSIDPPSWSAEQAVTNILYNTPPPPNQPVNRHVLNCLVQNEPGVLSRVSGILAGRGFNIESLVVCATEIRELSRMCIVLKGQDSVVEQARRQLEDLVPVWAVLDYTRNKTIERELLLVKVSILGPEYFQEQLHAKSKAKDFSKGFVDVDHSASDYSTHEHMSPSEALRQKHFHLQALESLASLFLAKVVDVSHDSVIIELSAKTTRIDAFLKLVRPYGILEAARTGVMVMPRAPIESDWQGMSDLEEKEDVDALDAGLLPPG
ncbi:small subunit of acetolactate synthase-domain-containing protein [Phakopsora pachyrhizi]|uniref:Small subunit of acetolactate synthase-domain-containing protein n=1 Tax=Phakopsora pachyrhizi TaxID=170000 RepID=A0AAV0AIR0_PHAPC|nr:small subunit of acetolactate synthase-domain-containing protein [Phakopsora pachyrhizi]CAH7666631.1 small subunit of acetolactate synthase-domain-containing protein [Phakopsora pachyrhizi]